MSFPDGSDGKASACNVGDPGLIPGLGRFPGEGNGTHTSILAWRIPWMEEHGKLDSIGLQYMEFRKIVTVTLYARQQNRHRCEEQSFGLCGRRWAWDDLREKHWNMYITICETDCQSRFDACDRVLRAGALGWPRGMGWGGRWEECSGWRTHVHSWPIQVNIWQKPLQYCKVISLQLK